MTTSTVKAVIDMATPSAMTTTIRAVSTGFRRKLTSASQT
jgi:hypothetical protein